MSQILLIVSITTSLDEDRKMYNFVKKHIYFSLIALKGYKYPKVYKQFRKEYISGIPENTTINLLRNILTHCNKSVPYYADLISQIDCKESLEEYPEIYLSKLPILTKDIIRANFEQLKSKDIKKRKWYINTSGGSTGEPVKLIQDKVYFDNSYAIKLLYSYLVGREIGEPEVKLWGSEKDIFQGTIGWKAKFSSFLRNTTYMNAFQMTPQLMNSFIKSLNQNPPNLILAYVQAIYELAKFAEQEKIEIVPQKAIITSAGTLYPWMKEKIETIFQCKVFNRYGSREVGDIACEKPGCEGLWVAPWGNYIEIVDDDNNPVPPGVEGNILVTSLTNFVMPLIRYKIGDRGSLSPEYNFGQVLQNVSGRNVDVFKTKDGTLIDGEYFTHLLYFKDWVKKFQVIQTKHSEIVIKIIKSDSDYHQDELDEIVTKSKLLMGEDCLISFEFVDKIFPSPSGKYRYTISEVS